MLSSSIRRVAFITCYAGTNAEGKVISSGRERSFAHDGDVEVPHCRVTISVSDLPPRGDYSTLAHDLAINSLVSDDDRVVIRSCSAGYVLA